MKTDMSEEQQFVTAIIDANGFFRVTRGEDSEPAQESLRCLISPELRPALRRWYQSFGASPMNPVAADFRHRLSELIGEAL